MNTISQPISNTINSFFEPVDLKILHNLREFEVEASLDFVDGLISTFLLNTPTKLSKLHQAVTHKDTEMLHNITYTIKFSSDTLGAKKLVTLCNEIEQKRHTWSAQELRTLLFELEEEYALVSQILNFELNESKKNSCGYFFNN